MKEIKFNINKPLIKKINEYSILSGLNSDDIIRRAIEEYIKLNEVFYKV